MKNFTCTQCQQEFDDTDNCYAIHEYGACILCTDRILIEQLDQLDPNESQSPNQFLLDSDSEFDKELYLAAEAHNTLVLDWN